MKASNSAASTTEAQSEPRGILRAAGILSVSTAASRVTGLMRESVLSWQFGAGAGYDAYAVGYRVANIARDLFAEGALSSAFVPTFSRYLATKSKEEARELSNITGTLVIVIVGMVCALGMIFSSTFVEVFAHGFHNEPGKFELASSLVRTIFPFLLFVALAAQAQGVLFSCHRYGIPAISSSLFNIGSIACGLTLGHFIDPLHGMAYGVLFGGAFQLAFQLPAVWRAGFAWCPRWNLQHEGVQHILKLMGPAILGGASVQINLLVNTNLAAGLPGNGAVSWLSYAFRFMQLPMGVFGVAIASATLPQISRQAALLDYAAFKDTLSRSLVMVFLLTVPSSVGLAILGESMIGIVYQHGRFLASDTHQTALALSCYAVGLAGYATVKLLAPAFYALGDSKTPMLVTMASVAVNAVSAFSLVHIAGFGHAGLALSLSVVSLVNAVTLAFLLRARLDGARVIRSLLKIALASAAMAAVVSAIVALHLGRVLNLALGVPAGVLVFYTAASTLRIAELKDVQKAISVKLQSSAS